jgi:hypothetical protein
MPLQNGAEQLAKQKVKLLRFNILIFLVCSMFVGCGFTMTANCIYDFLLPACWLLSTLVLIEFYDEVI